MSDTRGLIVDRLKREVLKRGLSYEDVALRSGLHPKTVERFLERITYSPDTADAITVGLRIELTDPTEERLLRGLLLWRLAGSPAWWARLGDLAVHAGADHDALRQRVSRALARGELAEGEVRRNVRDRDTTRAPCSGTLTTSRFGVTMLSARACLWVLLTATTERGEQAIAVLIDEGLERLRSAGIRR